MNPIPVYITVRDYGSAAAAMVRKLLTVPNCRPVIVDNASTWEPWVAWLDSAPCEVIRNSTNRGPRAALEQAMNRSDQDDCPYYVISDGDLDIEGVPLDVLDVLQAGLDACPEVGKVGLSIEIDDVPESYAFRQSVIQHERAHWAKPRGVGSLLFFDAPIDLTFCMLRSGEPYTAYEPALRSGRPYTARHLPWYFTSSAMTPEYRWFLDNLDDSHLGGANWTAAAVHQRRRAAEC